MNNNLNKVKQIELSIFNMFAEICNKHNLRYFVIVGTNVLGSGKV